MIQKILNLLQNVKSSGSGYSAKCPNHDDERNSLSVSVGNDGRILLYCHAGCEVENIIKSIGLSLHDFSNNQPISVDVFFIDNSY